MGGLAITGLEVAGYTIPYPRPIGSALGLYSGADWIVVTLHSKDGPSGTGFTMSLDPKGGAAVRAFIETDLAEMVVGADALAPVELWRRLWSPLKARMRAGIGMQALSAVDIAWPRGSCASGPWVATERAGCRTHRAPAARRPGTNRMTPARGPPRRPPRRQ